MLALTSTTLFTPAEHIRDPLLLIDGGIVVEVSSRASRETPKNFRLLDFGDAVLSPGLLDIHNHGGAGHDVMEASADALPAIERLLAQHGVTSYVPTTVTAPLDVTLAALERLANRIEAAEECRNVGGLRAEPRGIHIEGPFLSHRRRGVHPQENLLKPTLQTFERFWQAARGHIKMMTIAPELDGAAEVIAEASARGVCVSLGHSDADLRQARAGVAAGARHATHTFNAMRPLNHRDPGILAEVLTNSELTADVIADGFHVDPAVVKLFLHAKGPERAVLITDGTAGTGMPPGQYRMGTFEFEVRDGKCLANGVLAGSLLTLDQAVRNAITYAGWSLQQALRAATLNPAQILNLADTGSLKPGARADLLVLSSSGEVRQTVIAGRVSEAANTSS